MCMNAKSIKMRYGNVVPESARQTAGDDGIAQPLDRGSSSAARPAGDWCPPIS